MSGYARARACLNAEYRDYRESLDHAVRLQLLVPLSGTDDARQLLVDAYFAVETWPSGAKKLFVRTDREHTYLGQGFALMGLYRPNERIKGSGNDMTVSVDPLSGIYLKALWEELERLENARWEGRRPRENPRALASYQGRQGYTEPWWDDSGRYTLLGAPRRLPDDPEQRLGSRLCWTDVVEAAWRCYNPLRDLWVEDALDPDRSRRLEQCRCERWRFDGGSFAFSKRLAAVRWRNDAAQPQSLVLSPTAKRCFAALVAREPADGSIRIADLPAESDFDFLSLSGGFAVIHEQGVFLFDDWRTEPLRIEELRVEFTRICNLLGQIRWVAGQLDELMRPLPDAARSTPARPLVGMLADLTTLSTLRGRLARAKHQYGSKSAHEDVRRFRQHLESRWGIGAAVDALYQRVSEIEDAFRTAGALRTQGLVGIIATYGLPFFISGTITGFLSEWIEAWAMRIAWEPWTPLLKVGVYAAITGLLIAGIMALQRRVLDRSIQDRPDPPGAAEGSGRPTGFPDSKKSHKK